MHIRKSISVLLAATFILAAAGHAFAQEAAGEPVTAARVDAAVKKAVAFLKTLQKDDGSWVGSKDYESYYPFGSTALTAFALIKGGEPVNSDAIQKAIKYLRTFKEFQGVYAASCLVLLLAAIVEEGAKSDKEDDTGKDGMRTVPIEPGKGNVRKGWAKTPPWLRAWLQQAVNYLVTSKEKQGVWRYPTTDPGELAVRQQGVGGPQDASNTQYVMMAFYAARRVGITVQKYIYIDTANYFIKNQQPKGPKGPQFPVPGADVSMKKLRNLEKKWAKDFNKMLKNAKKQAKKDGEEFTGLDPTTVPMDTPEFGAEGEMRSRGWTYLPLDTPKTMTNSRGTQVNIPASFLKPTGSMTASGIISCMLCKAELEGTAWYKKNGKYLKRCIRDGWCWIAKNWTTKMNPGVARDDSWRYYYYYAIERAGVLSLVTTADEHDWYNEIGNIILGEQNSNGSWSGATGYVDPGFRGFDHGPMWNTCFAILFLKKATTPIINPTIFTGGYIDKEKKK